MRYRNVLAVVLIFFIFVLSGCETTVKIETPLVSSAGVAQVDNKGKPIYTTQKLSESAYVAMQTKEALVAMGTPVGGCSQIFPESFKDLSATGQVALARAVEMCEVRLMVASAMGRPSSAHGQVAFQNVKLGVAMEQGQAEKVKSGFNFGVWGVGALALVGVSKQAFSAAGDDYNVGDIQMSNSGESMGGEGGDGQGGDRNMALAIGGDSNFQPGDSNTQATAEKATSVDNPIVSGGPNNTIVDDSDGNNNDGQLF